MDEIYKSKEKEISDLKNKKSQMDLVLTEHSKIKTPIIYSEGNNFKLLQKAKNLLAPKLLLNFYDGGGDKELKLLFKTYSKNDHSLKRIFVFDCDAKESYDSCKGMQTANIIPFIFEKNAENTKCTKGIENLFSPKLFSQKVYSTNTTIDDYGAEKIIQTFNKQKFEEMILTEINEESNFYNLKPLFEFVTNIL